MRRIWAISTQASALSMVFLPIACQTAAATEPCEGTLHDPSARQHLEAPGGVGALDDLQRPAPEVDKGTPQLRSGIAAVGEDVAQIWGLSAEPCEDPGRAIAILNVGRMDLARDQVSTGIGDDVAPFGGALEPVAGNRLTP